MTPTPRPPGPALRTVLLDIDGTLIDSNDAHARAWVDSLRDHGYVIPFEEVRPLIGMGGDKMLPILTGLDPDSGEAKRMTETRSQLFLKVSLPSATPFILAGLKLGIGRGLIGVVVAELFGSRLGLGRMVGASADSFNMPELFAAVTILAVSGIAMTMGFAKLEARLVPWTKD